PWAAALAGAALCLALALPVLGLRLGFPDAGKDAAGSTTRAAYELVSEGFGAGANGPLLLAAELPSRGDLAVVRGLAERVRNTPGVAFVAPPRPSPAGDARCSR
ncbi:MAG: MMPL family transporter, partial [Actinomycetota bacterium]|nr:MMPL family transporter [Actinomycetota bacterium]